MFFYCMTICKTFFRNEGKKLKAFFQISPPPVSAFDASQKKSCIFSAVHQYKAATLLPPRLLPFLCSKKYFAKSCSEFCHGIGIMNAGRQNDKILVGKSQMLGFSVAKIVKTIL